MKIHPFLFVLVTCLQANAQQSTVTGIVSIFNSETNTGKRQYVSNALVEDDFDKANPVVTNNNGGFVLDYIGIKEKISVSFQVKKAGLQVVNIDALNAVTGQQEIVKISMAMPEKIAEYRRRIYEIGKTEAEKQLGRTLKEKNGELEKLIKASLQNKERIKLLQQEIAEVEEKRGKIETQALELSRKYGQVNLDDASPLFRKAFFLFQDGKLDSALQVLKDANLEGAVDKILEERRKINNIKNELILRDSLEKQRTKDISTALELKAEIHKTKYEFDSAMYCHEILIKLDSNNPERLFNYGYFLAWLNQYDKAISFYLKALKALDQVRGANVEMTIENKINVLNNLGSLYNSQKKFQKAETTYLDALQVYKKLSQDKPGTSQFLMASLLNNLGALYKDKNEFTKAEYFLLQSLKVKTEISKDTNTDYLSDLAAAQTNLGIIYSEQKKYQHSEEFHLKALQTYLKLAKAHPGLYEPMLATVQNNLGALYTNINNYDKAETAYLSSLAITKKLAENNPVVFSPGLAMILNNIGQIYTDKSEYNKAELTFQSALNIYKKLIIENPDAYKSEMATVLNSLGILYQRKNDRNKAENSFKDALTMYNQLAKNDPQVYEPDIARVKSNIGNILVDLNKYAEAEVVFQSVLASYKRLAQKNPQVYNFSLAGCFLNLGSLYIKAGDYTKSEANYLQALDIEKKIFANDKSSVKPEIAMVQNNLGILYLLSDKYILATNYLTESLITREQAYNIYPEVYKNDFVLGSKSLLSAYDAMLDSSKNQSFKNYNSEEFPKIEPVLTKAASLDTTMLIKLAKYYSDRSWALLEMSKLAEAQDAVQKAIKLKPSETSYKANLAHSLLLQGKYEMALQIYSQLKPLACEDGELCRVVLLKELSELEELGVTHKDVKRIKAFLTE